jgi:hypothetical protein
LFVDVTTGTRVTSFNFSATGLTPNGAAIFHVRNPQGATSDLPLVASAAGTVGRMGDAARPAVAGILGINDASIDDVTTKLSSNRVSFTVTSRCDINRDFLINNVDVNLIQQAILTGSTDLNYDINRDGLVNVADLQTVINATTNPDSCPL